MLCAPWAMASKQGKPTCRSNFTCCPTVARPLQPPQRTPQAPGTGRAPVGGTARQLREPAAGSAAERTCHASPTACTTPWLVASPVSFVTSSSCSLRSPQALQPQCGAPAPALARQAARSTQICHRRYQGVSVSCVAPFRTVLLWHDPNIPRAAENRPETELFQD